MKRLLAAILTALCIAAQGCAPATPVSLQATPATPATETAVAAASTPATPIPVTPSEYVPTIFPVTPTSTACAYAPGSQDLPELSRHFNAALQEISLDLNGLAYAYGENCVYGDGHQVFSAMETDFRVGVKVKTIRDEGSMGDWIAKIMGIVLDLPADEMVGSKAGRVDFNFKEPDPAQIFITVPIDKYRREADNLRGAELFHLFYPSP